jgi:hypothetical protein
VLWTKVASWRHTATTDGAIHSGTRSSIVQCCRRTMLNACLGQYVVFTRACVVVRCRTHGRRRDKTQQHAPVVVLTLGPATKDSPRRAAVWGFACGWGALDRQRMGGPEPRRTASICWTRTHPKGSLLRGLASCVHTSENSNEPCVENVLSLL